MKELIVWFFVFALVFTFMFTAAAFWTWIICLSYGVQFLWQYSFGTMVLIFLFGYRAPNTTEKIADKLAELNSLIKRR